MIGAYRYPSLLPPHRQIKYVRPAGFRPKTEGMWTGAVIC
ncbi:hypothetical protein BN2497_6223 [Janthinobacterium sp. CG23_2]|nr:hypothetical protein BN2497_6223 [Janthinobacterium sp. CG23_2]CUU29509.1 hypothetical protein BN3177_6223 [Janthinobacterium sp. CG23_2]